MSVGKPIRNAVAGALIAAVPVSATAAAVRPNAAVPAAASTAVTAQGESSGMSVAWPALIVIALTIAAGIWIAVDKDGKGHGDLSPG